MRMMGMGDGAYWLSWFVFYSVLCTVISTIAWAVLIINVFKESNLFYIWLYFWLFGEAIFGQIILY